MLLQIGIQSKSKRFLTGHANTCSKATIWICRWIFHVFGKYPVGIYLLKVNNRKTRTRCELCSMLKIKTPEGRHWRRSCVFIVNFEHISHLILVLLLLTLSRQFCRLGYGARNPFSEMYLLVGDDFEWFFMEHLQHVH